MNMIKKCEWNIYNLMNISVIHIFIAKKEIERDSNIDDDFT